MTSGRDGTGIAMERRRRHRYWALLIAGLAVAIGFGIVARHFAGPGGSIPPALAIALAAGLILMLVVGTWIYYRSVDELEWANNVIACFWGFNAFIIAFPVWLILHRGGLAPPPDTMIIYFGSALIALVAYCWKRFR